MPFAPAMTSACVLVTGATGFLGKVVLADLLRRSDALQLGKIYVVARKKGGKSPEQRLQQVANSPCFKGLGDAWKKHIALLPASLTQDRCGVSDADWATLTAEVTHIIHCAASVDFDLPLREASESNIVSSLNMLELARSCVRLQRMVSVSTAYTTPHRPGPLAEELAPLPRPAADLYREIRAGSANKAVMLQETGHPNTYTLTKCIAEHLLWEQRGDVPLSIVRPSIISAAWRFPEPGWIDSAAALAGFVSAIGAGYLHVVDGDYGTYLDVVPVDEVSARVIEHGFDHNDRTSRIAYAVAGLEHAYSIDEWVSHLENFFARYPIAQRARMQYLGPRNLQYDIRRALHHQLPSLVGQIMFACQGNHAMRRRARRLVQKLDMINRVFPYFTHKTFDFRPSTPLPETFDVEQYVPVICEGVTRHLLGKEPREVVLAGKAHKAPLSDMLWALSLPNGNWAIRMSGAVLTKALRRMFDEVTFDQKSFEEARRLAGQDAHLVFVPTHRSYMDFLACSYLFFARPNLGFPIPYIAAAQEFSDVRIVGWLFKQMHAFYLRRGTGKADPALNKQVHDLVDDGQALEFFIEGQRSRGRHFLAPRRGLLRCLQESGKRFAILPVSLSYDRVPEEATFLRELKGYPKDKMRLTHLLQWTRRMVRGEVKLGRMHMHCGAPLPFGADDDVHAASRAVMQALQANTVCTTYHLRAFVQAHPDLDIDAQWLQSAIEKRGGRVLRSKLSLPTAQVMDVDLERSLRNQWMHLFLPEACASQPDNVALAHYAEENCYTDTLPRDFAKDVRDGERLAALLATLFESVCADYAAVAQSTKRFAGKQQPVPTDQLVHRSIYRDFSTACAALRALQARGFVAAVDGGHYQVVARANQLSSFASQCAWAPDADALRMAGRRPRAGIA